MNNIWYGNQDSEPKLIITDHKISSNWLSFLPCTTEHLITTSFERWPENIILRILMPCFMIIYLYVLDISFDFFMCCIFFYRDIQSSPMFHDQIDWHWRQFTRWVPNFYLTNYWVFLLGTFHLFVNLINLIKIRSLLPIF
jgi:hypothetical protein